VAVRLPFLDSPPMMEVSPPDAPASSGGPNPYVHQSHKSSVFETELVNELALTRARLSSYEVDAQRFSEDMIAQTQREAIIAQNAVQQLASVEAKSTRDYATLESRLNEVSTQPSELRQFRDVATAVHGHEMLQSSDMFHNELLETHAAHERNVSEVRSEMLQAQTRFSQVTLSEMQARGPAAGPATPLC
jgi:hypothetical protein